MGCQLQARADFVRAGDCADAQCNLANAKAELAAAYQKAKTSRTVAIVIGSRISRLPLFLCAWVLLVCATKMHFFTKYERKYCKK